MGNHPFWRDTATGRFFDKKSDVPNVSTIEYWDSVLEFRAYQEIIKVIPSSQVSRQVVIPILPKNNFFPAWTWTVDFALDVNGIKILIEAKGKWILSDAVHRKCFVQNLRALQVNHNDLFSLLLIVDDSNWIIPGTSLQVISFEKLNNFLIGCR